METPPVRFHTQVSRPTLFESYPSSEQQKLMSSFSPKMTSKVNNYSLTQSDWCWWAAIIIKANSSNNNNNYKNNDDDDEEGQVREPLPHRGANGNDADGER